MKEKTSIRLSKELLASIDRVTGPGQSRSDFIEAVLIDHLCRRAQAGAEARELDLINTSADDLNREIEDVLHHQDYKA